MIQAQRHSILPPPRSHPIRPTRSASRVTQSGPPTSGGNDSIQEEGSAPYIQHTPSVGAAQHQLAYPTTGITCIGPACKADE